MSRHPHHDIDTADLIRRCMTGNDLIPNFAAAFDGTHNPAHVQVAYRAVADLALDVAIEDYEYAHRVIINLIGPAREAVMKTVMDKAWAAIDLRQPVYQFGREYDALCQRNDYTRSINA